MKASELAVGMDVAYRPATRRVYRAVVIGSPVGTYVRVRVFGRDGVEVEKSVPLQHVLPSVKEAIR